LVKKEYIITKKSPPERKGFCALKIIDELVVQYVILLAPR